MEKGGSDVFTRIYTVLLIVMALIIVLDICMLILVKNNMVNI